MRLMFYTDAHNSGTPPRNRIDNFPRVIPQKIRDAYAIARDNSCDFVVFGGDMCNTHKIFSFETIGDIMDAIDTSGVETYAAIGQHDLDSYNPSTYKSSSLSFIESRSKGKFKTIVGEVKVGEVSLWASHVWESLGDAKNLPVDKSRYNILVAHHLLTDNESSMYTVDNTQQFSLGSPFDLVLSGDLHDGYDHHCFGSTWFCNPGSLARRTTADADRTPRVAIIEFHKGQDPVIQYVNVPSGKLGTEVFNLDNELSELIGSARNTCVHDSAKRFSDMIQQFESSSEDIHSVVKNAAMALGYGQDVLEYLDKKRVEQQQISEKLA